MTTIIYSGHRGVEPDAKESCPGGGGVVIREFRVGPDLVGGLSISHLLFTEIPTYFVMQMKTNFFISEWC